MTPNINAPANLRGRTLDGADYASLEARWISGHYAEMALLRRVETNEGAELVGRIGRPGRYSGIAIPYMLPGQVHVREYRLRRDHPDIEVDAAGNRKERGKYMSPPGRGNMLYFPPGLDPTLLDQMELPVVVVEGEFKTLALWRLAWYHNEAAEYPSFVPIGLSGVWNWRGRYR